MKEVIFADKVLILEGQQDVGLLKKWLFENKKPVNFDIFGYGAGGETKIEVFLKLCKDLGLIKVAAIYDKNATKYAESKKSFPRYKILNLPTNDIVDKNDAKKIEGIFDRNGKIKNKYKSKFEKIINTIIKFLNEKK